MGIPTETHAIAITAPCFSIKAYWKDIHDYYCEYVFRRQRNIISLWTNSVARSGFISMI